MRNSAIVSDGDGDGDGDGDVDSDGERIYCQHSNRPECVLY